MTTKETPYVGFTCAYTPLPLIEAAGYAPFRILPMGDSPDRAGQLLHDNLCPHVKRVLDRALDGDLPEMVGVVLMNSCDAMRRLADVWPSVRPNDRLILIDLPFTPDEAAISYFSGELSRLEKTLADWSGKPVSQEDLAEAIAAYNRLSSLFVTLRERMLNGSVAGGAARIQDLYNRAVTRPFLETLAVMDEMISDAASAGSTGDEVPVYAFGNVLPDPEAFELFASCGASVVDEDFCTGSRAFSPMDVTASGNMLPQMAKALLERPRCARTLHGTKAGTLAQEVLDRAIACKAQGVIACTAKFCDPYIARMPSVRQILREAGIPLLHIEGDCTMRSFGQQRTRIEAFAEMLRG